MRRLARQASGLLGQRHGAPGMLTFAIFDHLDSDGGPLGQFFENRLRLLQLIEQSGFHAYHMAEHHSTPLGMAGSPSVFLAAAIQRMAAINSGGIVSSAIRMPR